MHPVNNIARLSDKIRIGLLAVSSILVACGDNVSPRREVAKIEDVPSEQHSEPTIKDFAQPPSSSAEQPAGTPPVLEAPQIGRYSIGDQWQRLTSEDKQAGCNLADESDVDCIFTDQDGVEYVAFGKTVSKIVLRRGQLSHHVALPFGLDFGMSAEATQATLRNSSRANWHLASTPDGKAILTSENRWKSKAGNVPFDIVLYFAIGGLFEVSYETYPV